MKKKCNEMHLIYIQLKFPQMQTRTLKIFRLVLEFKTIARKVTK